MPKAYTEMSLLSKRLEHLSCNHKSYFENIYVKELKDSLETFEIYGNLWFKCILYRYNIRKWDDINNLSDNARLILMRPLKQSMYILGFDMSNAYKFSHEDVLESCKKLSEIGIEDYCAAVSKLNMERLSDIRTPTSHSKIDIKNKTDITGEHISHYNIFDIVLEISDGCWFAYNRKNVPKMKCNPYTKKPFTRSLSKIVNDRNAISEVIGLPNSDTIISFLKNPPSYEQVGDVSKIKESIMKISPFLEMAGMYYPENIIEMIAKMTSGKKQTGIGN